MKTSAAEILREYVPFSGADRVHGVTFDGQRVWFASGDRLNGFDPATGKIERTIDVAAHAGTAFDGQHLFQIAEHRIQKIDPTTGLHPEKWSSLKYGYRADGGHRNGEEETHSRGDCREASAG